MMNLRRLAHTLAAGMLTVSLCACGAASNVMTAAGGASSGAAGAAGQASQKRRIIIDTDMGADDASALVIAASHPDVQIEGVTVIPGNVNLDQAARNALAVLELANCNAPVYKGSDTAFDGHKKEVNAVFGVDGMGDADLIHPKGTAAEGDAVDFIINTAKAHPGEVEIVALGPVTNVAKAIRKDPEAMKQVAMVWSMGTAGLGPGNATPVAEFNVYADAHAYQALLDFDVPVTVVGLDACSGEAEWNDTQFEELEQMGEKGEFFTKAFELVRMEDKRNGHDAMMNCDAVTMMCALQPYFVNTKRPCSALCVTDDEETYGQVIFYQQGHGYVVDTSNMTFDTTLVGDVDKEECFECFKAALVELG